jgi:putative holliday junction resolvase
MKTITNSLTGLFLGIDFGKTNIGLAIGRNGLVTPLEIIPGKNIENSLHQINRTIIENKVDKIVVGLPLTADGKDTAESIEIRRFAKLFKVTTKRPVEFQNEYGTSKGALEEALDLDTPRDKRKTNDHLAAALILKMYFDEKTGL